MEQYGQAVCNSGAKIVPCSSMGEEQKDKRGLKSLQIYRPVLDHCCSIQRSALTTISAVPLLFLSAKCRNRPLCTLRYWGVDVLSKL